jgi:hypothetical protein
MSIAVITAGIAFVSCDMASSFSNAGRAADSSDCRIAASVEKSVAAQPGIGLQQIADRMMQICITPEAI